VNFFLRLAMLRAVREQLFFQLQLYRWGHGNNNTPAGKSAPLAFLINALIIPSAISKSVINSVTALDA